MIKWIYDLKRRTDRALMNVYFVENFTAAKIDIEL